MTAFKTLRATLETLSLSDDAYADAHRLQLALHQQGYAVLPISRTFRVERSGIRDGHFALMIDDLPPDAAQNATSILSHASIWQSKL